MPISQLRRKKPNNSRIIVPRRVGSYKKRSLWRSVSGWKRKRNNKGLLKKILFWAVSLFLLFAFLGIIVLGGALLWFSKDLPDPDKLIERNLPLATKIYDRSGESLLYEIHGDQNRTFIPFEKIPAYAIHATIAMEDKTFFQHKGFSLWGIFRGVIISKLKDGRTQGGSTITQQFIKNAILSNERTIQRKIKELILAWRIEKKFSKNEILQLYFNEIPYGSTAYGIEAASNLYFGKSASDINIAESAILAALPKAPTYYSPYGSHKDKLINRQQYILKLMKDQGYIDEQEYEDALSEELVFTKRYENIKAPHFVMYVKEILTLKYGEKMVEQGGLKVITTLDLYKQEKAEEAVAQFAEINEENHNAKNASLVAIDAKTGQILSMVGSRDYFDLENDGNVNVAIRLRQPGSSLKPLVYALSFESGYTPDTILYDAKTDFGVYGAEKYSPNNYDNVFRGPVTIRKSLAGSLNVPAVKALYLTGIDKVLDQGKELGYTTLDDKSRFGLSLVLGGGEVKLLEHTGAYAAFARDGIYHPVTGILRVEDSKGEFIEEYKEKEKRIISAQAVRLLNSILSDNSARAYAFGENNLLNLGDRPVCAKTGTTNDYKDAWTIGYTPSLAVGVWGGNNSGEEMKRGAGGSKVAAPIWHKFMESVLGKAGDGEPIEQFIKPDEIKTDKPVLIGVKAEEETLKIDKFSQKLATEYTPEEAIEEKIFNQFHSILHYVDKNNPQGENPENPESDPQYKKWEEAIIEWAKTANDSEIEIESPPTEYDDIHIPENKPSIAILNLTDNQEIKNDELFINIEASAPRGLSRIDYFIGGTLIDSITGAPYDLYWAIEDVINTKHILRAIAYDDVLNSAEVSLTLNFNIIDEPLSVVWIRPANNQQFSKSDFPINVSVALSRVKRLKKIDFFIKEASSSDAKLLSSVIKPQEKNISLTISDFPAEKGFYKIYLVATDINDKRTTDSGVLIKIK